MKISRTSFFLIILLLMLVIMFLIYLLISQPIGSIKLYEDLSRAEEYKDVKKLIDSEYGDPFTEADFNRLKGKMDQEGPDEINEYSLFKYNDKWILIEKSPGTKNNILSVKILEKDEIESLREFFN